MKTLDSESRESVSNPTKVPQTDEVDRIEVRKENERARMALEIAKRRHHEKMAKLKVIK